MVTPQQLGDCWTRLADRLLLYARSLGYGSAAAEDALQNAFVRLAQQRSMPDNPAAWLSSVIRNRWVDESRRLRREAIVHEHWRTDRLPGVNPPLVCEQQEESARLQTALETLEPLMREVVVLHLWAELTFDQIAEQLNIHRSAAYRMYQAGLSRLREIYPEPRA